MASQSRLWLVELRDGRALTQERLAELIGVDVGTVGRWERGRQDLRARNLAALADALQVPLATIRDLVRREQQGEDGRQAAASFAAELVAADRSEPSVVPGTLYVPTDLDVLERIRRSELTGADIDAITSTVDSLCSDYSSRPAELLLPEAKLWLHQLDQVLNGRLSTKHHQAVMTQAGWTALLIGSLEFDSNDRRSTERVQRLAADIGSDLDHGVISAWAQELKAWVALNDGDYRRAVIEAQIGQAMAPHSPIVVQLLGHEAEALGRMGDLPAAERALGRMNELRTDMPRPDQPQHHYQLEASKFDKVEIRLLTLFGQVDQAGSMAEQVLKDLRRPDGEWRHPMAAAKAIAALGLRAAHHGDIDAAVAHGHQALDIPRQSIPSLVSTTVDLMEALVPASRNAEVVELRDRIAELSAA